MSKTTMRFTAHDNLIIDVIRRQSGTLAKAALEGVMNSIDAGATRIDVTLQPSVLIISDDGKGFKSRAEIEEYFAKFGTPHTKENGEVTDARFGEFRMGRGQLFAFGRNIWKTGEFDITVDIDKTGLDFEVAALAEPVKGCRVEVNLYERLTANTLLSMIEDVTRNCKYVDIDLYLNGKKINTPPAECDWTEETDDAYILVKEGSRGINFYQQGVFVQNLSTWQVGASGVIVTKKRVALNFARNEVMRSDTRFKRIMEKFRKDTETRAQTKKTLSVEERTALLKQLSTGALHWRDNLAAKLFADTSGRAWSINQLRRLQGQAKYAMQPDTRIGFSFAEVGNRQATQIMNTMRGLVFDEAILDIFDCAPADFFTDIDYSVDRQLKFVELHNLAKVEKDDADYRLVEVEKQTAQETRMLSTLHHAQWAINHTIDEVANRRREDYTTCVLRVGISNSADIWTDGDSYIAFNRNLLARCGTTPGGFAELLALLTHEMCYGEDDTCSHTHTLEFYKLVHDVLTHEGSLRNLVNKTYTNYVNSTEKAAQLAAREEIHLDNEKLLATAQG